MLFGNKQSNRFYSDNGNDYKIPLDTLRENFKIIQRGPSHLSSLERGETLHEVFLM